MTRKSAEANSRFALYSCLSVNAKPKRPLSVARERMLSLPNVMQTRHGTEMEFAISLGDNTGQRDPLLQLGKGAIRLKFFFEAPGLKAYRANLGIFISLLSYLNDLFDIDIKPLYPQLIEFTSGLSKEIEEARMASGAEAMETKIIELSRSNVQLSNHIFSLEKRLETSEHDYLEFKGAMLKVIMYFIDREGEDKSKLGASLQVFGFSREESEKLIDKCGIMLDKGILHARKP
ncbi:MAG: hypothetical protein QXW10_01740 [Candidatus Micrarchaeaceae archaeon]